MKKKILIVDDSSLFRTELREILQDGYDILEADSGTSALDLVGKEKPNMVLLDTCIPSMDGFELCRLLRTDESNVIMPIIMMDQHDDKDACIKGLELGADDYMQKPLDERELKARINNIFRRIDRNRNANPLTGLFGNLEIQNEVTKRLKRDEKFSVLYMDLDNFKSYNDAYGFAKGDTVIVLTADIIRDQAKLWGDSKTFVGHIGGDDFIAVTTPDKAVKLCEEIIATFDEKVVQMYSQEDRDNGFVSTINRRGNIDVFPLMTISIAVVSNERRQWDSYMEVGDVAAEIKHIIKRKRGSNYMIDRRCEGMPEKHGKDDVDGADRK